MLKALEISGFKSFADKTRFEFPPGITVIVGPNGSGKSNIVDAIKWVLGEQSAKSLRGKDMSDVIFKGSSGPGARKPAGSATASIVLDNADRRFPYDADEVHIGRRVYRSGETEYLINGEAARLKDIKNLLRGTGVGTDAYSLIEQGKVDRLLQASPRERRAIFEEAAGISRFKAKKIEAARRLERVEESLVRLADIVDEVGSRYRSVKRQAAKAASYREASSRLQQLRTFVGLKDWRAFSDELAECQAEHSEQTAVAERLRVELEQREEQAREVDTRLEAILAELETAHARAADLREQVAHAQSRIELNESRLADLDERADRLQDQQQRARQRQDEAEQALATSRSEMEQAEQEYTAVVADLERLEGELGDWQQQEESLGEQRKQIQREWDEHRNLAADIGRVVSAAESQLETLSSARDRYLADVQRLSAETAEAKQTWDQLIADQETLKERAASKDSALATARQRLADLEAERGQRQDQLSQSTNEHTGLSQRAGVIEELENRLEGINAGARELLQLARTATEGPATEVLGLVADLVSVNVEYATVVDAALGPVAQYVVVAGDRLIDALATERIQVRGRVGILSLNDPACLNADPAVDLSDAEGILGRASQLVNRQTPHAEFVQRLLSGTWLVKTLGRGLEIREQRRPKARMVTLDGEVIEADGTVIAGPRSSAAGLVSRRSELRLLKRQIAALEDQIATQRRDLQDCRERAVEADEHAAQLLRENTELTRQLNDREARANTVKAQLKSLSGQLRQGQQDLKQTTQRLEELNRQLTADRSRLEAAEEGCRTAEISLEQNTEATTAARQNRAALDQSATSARVRLAKCEQLRDGHVARLQQLEQDLAAARQAAEEIDAQRQADHEHRERANGEREQAAQQLAGLLAQQEQLNQKLEEQAAERADWDRQRKELAQALQADRDAQRRTKDRVYQAQLTMEQLDARRTQLAERLLEDYGIDISQVKDAPLSDEQLAEREEIDREINALRRELADLGSVNLEALEELESLEARYTTMDAQYQDLVQAKETLEKIIIRINADSRRLFVETLEAIRANFQKLFRQTFGGGQADIVLEEGVDPLEAGVEIVATPPGKPQFSNSLLSGGEKALTAVSLLMAIFQFRPSPFCVLDEVDAPFDEANIGRFVDVLRSFLGWTKFVIVTHSKKTMTAATTLYGVTMQESGVSKRVSVRFEDVSEDGQISQAAIDRDDEAA